MENHLNITNQFVPYELSVKLKELGFNEKCVMSFNYIPRNGNVRLVYGTVIEEDYIPAPLLQQAARFIYISSNKQINIIINGKDNYKELCEKFKKAIEDFRNL